MTSSNIQPASRDVFLTATLDMSCTVCLCLCLIVLPTLVLPFGDGGWLAN